MGLWSLARLLTLALLNRRDPIRVPDQNSTGRVADILALRSLAKMRVPEALPSAVMYTQII
jgi:hypothetical protein